MYWNSCFKIYVPRLTDAHMRMWCFYTIYICIYTRNTQNILPTDMSGCCLIFWFPGKLTCNHVLYLRYLQSWSVWPQSLLQSWVWWKMSHSYFRKYGPLWTTHCCSQQTWVCVCDIIQNLMLDVLLLWYLCLFVSAISWVWDRKGDFEFTAWKGFLQPTIATNKLAGELSSRLTL